MDLKVAASYAPVLTSGPMTGVAFDSAVNLQVLPKRVLSLELLVTVGPNAANRVLVCVHNRVHFELILAVSGVLTSGPFAAERGLRVYNRVLS